MNYKVGDRILVNVAENYYTGHISIIMDKSNVHNNILMWYTEKNKKHPLFVNEENIVGLLSGRHMCPECGMDYADEDIADHMMQEHLISIEEYKKDFDLTDECKENMINSLKKYYEAQAQEELKQMDEILKSKAEQYDRICEMMFSACGIVEDGESIKYIIDPETVADELLRIMVDDDKIDRQTFVDRKKRIFSDAVGW